MLSLFMTACNNFDLEVGKVEKIGEENSDGSYVNEDGDTVLPDGTIVTDGKIPDKVPDSADKDSEDKASDDEDDGDSEPLEPAVSVPEGESLDAKITQRDMKVNKNIAKPVGNQRCVAYYTSWSAYARAVEVGAMDPNLITHINFAFANLQEDGSIVVGDSWVDVEKPFGNDSWESAADSRGHFNQLRLMKEKYPHIKTLISVGGWTWSGKFSGVAANEASRKKFAQTALDFCLKYGFDGLDIDWEYPVEGGDNIPHLPEDKENYTKLVAEVRRVFDEQEKKDGHHYLLTIAAGANPTFVQNTEIKKMMEYLDYINLMTYDFHGGSWEEITGHNAPLYSTNPDDPLCVSNSIETYLAAGIDPQDMNMGLAYYGRGWVEVSSTDNYGYLQSAKGTKGTGFGLGTWEGTCFDYWDLTDNYIGKSDYKRYFDEVAKVPYLFNGSTFISYDDAESILYKLDYANQKKLGGVMFWEFSGDKHMELQKLVAEAQDLNKSISAAASEGNTATTAPDKKPSGETETTAISDADSSIPEWDANATYNAGDKVRYKGHIYQANWWTQGDEPSGDEWGAWKKIS